MKKVSILCIMERRVTLESNLSDQRISYPAVPLLFTKCPANATEKCTNIMHPRWKIYGETFFQTRIGVWPLWQEEQHWKVPSRVSGFPTLQCLSSGNSRLLLEVTVRPFDTRYFSYSPCNFFPTIYSSDGHLGERSGFW